MRLKFSRTVPAGRSSTGQEVTYLSGMEYEVKDQHAAEVYVAHGYATVVSGGKAGRETLEAPYPREAETQQPPTSAPKPAAAVASK